MLNNNLLGIFWIIVASVSLSVFNASARLLSDYVNSIDIIVYITIICFVMLIPLYMIKRYKFNWLIQRWNILRAILGTVGNTVVVYSITQLPFAHVTVLTMTTPLFIILLSIIFFDDRLTFATAISLVLGFVGMLIVVEPWDTIDFSIISIFVLFSSLLWAIDDIIAKYTSLKDSISSQIFYLFLFKVICILPILFYCSNFDYNNIYEVSWYSIIGAISILLLTMGCYKAFSYADLSILTPFYFLDIIFAAAVAYVLFNEVIKINTIIGSILICISSIYMVYSNKR